ncbi:MAG: cell division protein ZapA [Eubacteriaceae bacterium]|jgi:cell division protein ZapA|nr:cell division protein ZapA [Eubacteriaceae bacterium]
MSEQKNTTELKIFGINFHVKTGDNIEEVLAIAEYVDKELNEVKEKNPYTNNMHIAILGAMNISERLEQAQEKVDIVKAAEEEAKSKISELEGIIVGKNREIQNLQDQKRAVINEKEELNQQLNDKEELLNQYRDHLKQSKSESENDRKTILDLQNQLFECQIELVKAKKGDEETAVSEDISE